MTIRARVAEPGVTSGIRLRVGEDLAAPKPSPLTQYGENLRLWFEGGTDILKGIDPDDPAGDGDTVVRWKDQTTNAYHGNNSNTPIYDIDALNDIGGVVFADVENDALNISNLAIDGADTEITIFSVFKCSDAVDNRQICLYNRAGVACFAIQAMGASNTIRCWRNLGGAGADQLIAVVDPVDFHVVTFWQKEGTGAKIFVDGVQEAISGRADAFASTGWVQEFTIGQDAGGEGAGFTGTLMELFMVVGEMTDVNRQWGDDYLLSRYSLS